MYNRIFVNIVFYLDKVFMNYEYFDFVDLYRPFHYNILVYMLMEFREHAIYFINILYYYIVKEKNDEKNLSA